MTLAVQCRKGRTGGSPSPVPCPVLSMVRGISLDSHVILATPTLQTETEAQGVKDSKAEAAP